MSYMSKQNTQIKNGVIDSAHNAAAKLAECVLTGLFQDKIRQIGSCHIFSLLILFY